jgi:hypothetical protein
MLTGSAERYQYAQAMQRITNAGAHTLQYTPSVALDGIGPACTHAAQRRCGSDRWCIGCRYEVTRKEAERNGTGGAGPHRRWAAPALGRTEAGLPRRWGEPMRHRIAADLGPPPRADSADADLYLIEEWRVTNEHWFTESA